jgi:hypothetical protein
MASRSATTSATASTGSSPVAATRAPISGAATPIPIASRSTAPSVDIRSKASSDRSRTNIHGLAPRCSASPVASTTTSLASLASMCPGRNFSRYPGSRAELMTSTPSPSRVPRRKLTALMIVSSTSTTQSGCGFSYTNRSRIGSSENLAYLRTRQLVRSGSST